MLPRLNLTSQSERSLWPFDAIEYKGKNFSHCDESIDATVMATSKYLPLH